MRSRDLFEAAPPSTEALGLQALVLRGFALPSAAAVIAAVQTVLAAAPLRHMVTPGGFRMSVALTNCGALGWTSDRHSYRYASVDPHSGLPWPAMPEVFQQLAGRAAAAAGFADFVPDACLINCYQPGAKLSMHQDKDEADFGAPIVSVSLGMPATFVFGGLTRSGPSIKTALHHGDVVVWGGADRLRYHGVLPLKDGEPHPLLGPQRINLTFRKAG